MLAGYMGKLLFVDLSKGKITEETPDEQFYRDYMGGYGIGARILYSRMKAGADPLGPDNILGILPGPCTGTAAHSGARFTVVGKSPLTGGWGDANSGGSFGPYLKFAGFDGVFFSGISPKPVYLLIDEGKAELKDAGDLWGKDAYETEELLDSQYGKQSHTVCIGQAGEKLSLIASIMTDKGSAAGRSGLGAVMGSKKLKAVVARGTKTVTIADKAKLDQTRKDFIKILQQPGAMNIYGLHRFGTSALTANSAHSGDTPVRNWGGIGVIDLPDVEGLKAETLEKHVTKLTGCWHCAVACKALLKEGSEYKYVAGIRRPEYETQASFGACCGNNNLESINMANDLCNRYGLDTISAGTVVAFAMECYENGVLTQKDTGGIKLGWGDHRGMVEVLDLMGKREGIGEILADGVKIAAKKIGRGAEKFAVHIGGQELGMHDPKLGRGPSDVSSFARFQMDATPGRHTQGAPNPGGMRTHFLNASGMCMIGYGFTAGPEWMVDFVNAVTGFNYSVDEGMKVGERILNLRHVFNLREGVLEKNYETHPRIYGEPPQKAGPLAGVSINVAANVYWNLGAMDWDPVTMVPSKKRLESLGLDDVAKDFYPENK
jgi:aldehyde:ferredoxin oxidoreductase